MHGGNSRIFLPKCSIHDVTNLTPMTASSLSPLPGSNDEIFYFQGDEVLDCEGGVTNRLAPSNLYGTDDDFSAEDEQSNILEKDVDDDDGDALSLEEEEKRTSVSDSDPPMFFRFTLDGKNVSLQDILTLKKSAYLCAQVTVFGKTQKLPPFHAGVISKLRNALNSFASEQTLEKHRFFGEDSLTQEAFKTIMRNLPQTKHHSLEIPLVFFVSRSDSLISASNPTGSSENELEHGFSILMTELERNENTIRASHTSYLVLDDAACRNVFPFWCFIQVRKDRGSIIVRVYHPSGEKAAEDQGELTRKLVETICHRTNQLLLLESLYRTKNASNLLIPEDDSTMDERGPDKLVDDENFSCPIQYRMPTPLNHRVAPTQAIVSLDSTVLQNFLVSNRRGIFTYKDESDNVFYMKLNCFKKPDAEEGEHNPHIIELQVYGVDYPGPSITEQLARLLQKKLLQLPLDFLGSVLKKNPYYQLLPADLAFLKQFRSAWRELEHESDTNFPESPRVYDLPHQIEDPVMLLLMFRQNISGSTFIQHLHESTEEKFAQVSDVMLKDDTHGDFKIKFLPKEFLFYFNSSPSQLDPNYQPVTTLTEKGRLFSRQAGVSLQ